MALFDYSGFDERGKNTRGTIEAGSKRAALEQLRQGGIYVSAVNERQRETARSGFCWRRTRLSATELATATRLLATMLQAGVALDEALQSLLEQLDRRDMERIFAQVREEVRQGSALHVAMAQQRGVFPELYLRIVQVGESSGSLDTILLRLADFLEEQARLRARVTAALAYPALMLLVGGVVLVFLVTFVLPRITRMLVDLGQTLPAPTRLLIALAEFFAAYGWLLLVFFVIALWLGRRYYLGKGRHKVDALLLKLPLVGRLLRQVATARFSRTLGTLLYSGMPLLAALEISSGLLANRILRRSVDNAVIEVREGGSLAAAIKRDHVFMPLLAQMAAIGERSGNLDEMLFKVAEQQEKQVEITIGALMSLLEPLMILAMGAVIGFIVLAVLLPIFQASQIMG